MINSKFHRKANICQGHHEGTANADYKDKTDFDLEFVLKLCYLTKL